MQMAFAEHHDMINAFPADRTHQPFCTSAVESDLHETDDLRVLDFNGQRVFQLFRFDELGALILQEQP